LSHTPKKQTVKSKYSITSSYSPVEENNLHIAQIGTGRVGRPTAYTLMSAKLADTITVCDTKAGLAKAFAEELRHVTASLNLDIEIIACERDDDVTDADIILISAGKPRTPGVTMSRRDLAVQNGQIVKYVAESTAPNNPDAKYVVITNPVDAMAMVCKKYCGAEFVISTGTNLESLRFRSRLAKALQVPVSAAKGWVGGEHGKDALILWSTVEVGGIPLEEYLNENERTLEKAEIDAYMKEVSKTIVDDIGGTEYGPAVSFTDITRAIAKNTNEIIPVAAPQEFEGVPEPVFVSVPRKLGETIGESIYDSLPAAEKAGIKEAAEAIYQNFRTAIQK
jgi:malate dehydrogenase